MGGLLIVGVVLGIGLIVELTGGDFIDSSTFAPLATLALVGLLGTADDWLNARTGDGISAPPEAALAVGRGRRGGLADPGHLRRSRRSSCRSSEPWPSRPGSTSSSPRSPSWPAATPSTSPTGSTASPAARSSSRSSATWSSPRSRSSPARTATASADPADLPLLCALIIGALLAFLWFNVHPAQVFMGDSGALALGATLAVIALITGQVLLLPLIGLVFVLETGRHPPGRFGASCAASGSSSWRRCTTTSS